MCPVSSFEAGAACMLIPALGSCAFSPVKMAAYITRPRVEGLASWGLTCCILCRIERLEGTLLRDLLKNIVSRFGSVTGHCCSVLLRPSMQY